MARKETTPAVEEELLEKKPYHPEATAMLLLSAVCLIGAIVFTSSHLFGRYFREEADVQAIDEGKTPAQAALERVMKRDPEMKKIIQSLESDS